MSLIVGAVPASSQTLTANGLFSVNNTPYSPWGIDIPPLAQTCARGWPAGVEAAQTFARLTEGKTVTCELRGKDRTGRAASVCSADGVDIGREMVRAGMAWARLGVDNGYVMDEAKAAAAYTGVHGHRCLQPDVWRTRKDTQ